MNFNWKEIKLSGILKILAEIATVLSLILAWIVYQKSKNSSTTPSPGLSPIIIIFIIVNVAMFLFLSVTIMRAILIYVSGGTYRLVKKFDEFAKSSSPYLSKMQKDSYDRLMTKTKKALKNLDDNKTFDEDVYYMMLYSLFHTADGSINVVSILDDSEWVDTPEEDEFLRVNIAIKDKRTHLNRIFVVDENEAASKLNNKSIQSFLEADHTYIHLFVVFRDKLSRSLVNDISSGFIEFYKFAVACDIFADNEIRGKLILDGQEVERYNKIYMQLTEFYQPLNKDFIAKYFPAQKSVKAVGGSNC